MSEDFFDFIRRNMMLPLKLVHYASEPDYAIDFDPRSGMRFECRSLQSAKDCSSSRAAEEQDVAVRVLELETAQTVMSIFQWFRELDIARSKFGR
jgi:hypothetical protein